MKGHIQQRRERSYRLTVELPRGEDDRRRRHRETSHGTDRARAMVRDRRAAVVVVPDHVYGTAL